MKKPGSFISQPNAPMAADMERCQEPSLYTLIEQQPFFKGLNGMQLQMLADSALVMEFQPGEKILHEGAPANRFFLILEGQVSFEMELDANGATMPLQTLGPGDDVGWSWLFPPYALHFSARAIERTRTIFFYGTRLREQCELDHEFGYQLMKRIAEVATKCLQAMQQRFVESAAGTSPGSPSE
jgi:CRP/FNR family cyclic AMP-dependent transcriptional regulator